MSDGISWNFTDAQGRCFIAGTEVPREVYDEFETAWGRVAKLEDALRLSMRTYREAEIEGDLLRNGIRDHQRWVRQRDASGWMHRGTLYQAPNERLWSLLDTSHDQQGDDDG